jgi:hypothetical protein
MGEGTVSIGIDISKINKRRQGINNPSGSTHMDSCCCCRQIPSAYTVCINPSEFPFLAISYIYQYTRFNSSIHAHRHTHMCWRIPYTSLSSFASNCIAWIYLLRSLSVVSPSRSVQQHPRYIISWRSKNHFLQMNYTM